MNAPKLNKFYFLVCILIVSTYSQAELRAADECVEEEKVLSSEFLPIDFDKGRSTVGVDQVEPVKSWLQDYVITNPSAVISKIEITSSASKAPFYKQVGKKKVIDQLSDERNINLAKERVVFVEKVISGLQKSLTYSKVKFETKALLAGPDFSQKDLNDRFVTHMTPEYSDKIERMYQLYKTDYEELALKRSSQELLDEKKFVNLYQAKFKPFLGFKVVVKGHKKEEMKCLTPGSHTNSSKKSSRQ